MPAGNNRRSPSAVSRSSKGRGPQAPAFTAPLQLPSRQGSVQLAQLPQGGRSQWKEHQSACFCDPTAVGPGASSRPLHARGLPDCWPPFAATISPPSSTHRRPLHGGLPGMTPQPREASTTARPAIFHSTRTSAQHPRGVTVSPEVYQDFLGSHL